MSNVLNLNNLLYFPIPKDVFTLGRCSEIKGSPVTLYAYICYLSQEKTKASVHITNEELLAVTGMSKNTILNARAALEDAGFIRFSKGSNGYTYILLNPATGKALVNSVKGEYEPLDFNSLDANQSKSYYARNTKGSIVETKTGIMMCCPFHDDSTPSLSIDLDNGSRWYCHTCGIGGRLIEFESRLASIHGETISSSQAHKRIRAKLVAAGAINGTLGLPDAVYPYHSADGKLLFEVLRYKGKKFKQRRPDPDKRGYYIWNVISVQRVLYGLPSVNQAEVVIILEGEKDCDNLRLLNMCDDAMNPVGVTTCPGGASNWQSSYSKSLIGKKVVIFRDQNFAGWRHGKSVEQSLMGFASEVHVCDFPDGFRDMTEYLGRHDIADLALLIDRDWISVPVPI